MEKGETNLIAIVQSACGIEKIIDCKQGPILAGSSEDRVKTSEPADGPVVNRDAFVGTGGTRHQCVAAGSSQRRSQQLQQRQQATSDPQLLNYGDHFAP